MDDAWVCVCVCSTAEKLRDKIPGVEKDLEKSQNELANLITQEDKVSNEVNVVCLSAIVLFCIEA